MSFRIKLKIFRLPSAKMLIRNEKYFVKNCNAHLFEILATVTSKDFSSKFFYSAIRGKTFLFR